MIRSSARLRLTAAFTLGALIVGTAIVAAVFLVMRYVPDYQFLDFTTSQPASLSPDGADELRGTPGLGGEPSAAPAAAAVVIRGESDVLRILLVTSGIVLGVTTLACVALSWHLAGRVLRPVQALSDAAATAEHGAGTRITVSEPADEFGRLATTLNEMFDRLDRSYAAQQRFAANASHELRTPLATTQAMLDVALGDPDGVDVERLATRLRDTNARSIGTVNALLELADAQAGDADREPVDLRAVVLESIAAVRPDALVLSIGLDTRLDAVMVEGDRALLGSMVTNLLSNAVRHNVDGGEVRVVLDAVGLRVANGGPVIDPSIVARLTEPFFRAAGRVDGSHGIGLALVAAVAELHGAELRLVAPPTGGLVVDVVLAAVPVSDEAAPVDDAQGFPVDAHAFPVLAQ
jgi:two-component system sensor histidine kinase VanS